MFAADPKLLSRITPHIQRVLIIDPNPAATRLLADLMKALGARELLLEPEERRAFDVARDADPQIIFVERAGQRLDGEAFTKKLRRSNLGCRMVPVVMVTSDATASTIKGARDAGVHEFLRKPFTSGDLLRRVANVALKPRDWIEAVQYVGPDRRRFNSGEEYTGARKRRADKAQSEADIQAAATDQAVRILRSAVTQFDSDPAQALRAMREQANALKKQSTLGGGHARLAVAVAGLEIALSAPAPSRADLLAPATAILDLYPVDEKARASAA